MTNYVLLTDGRFTFELDIFGKKGEQGGMLLDNGTSGRILGNPGQPIAVMEKGKDGIWRAFSSNDVMKQCKDGVLRAFSPKDDVKPVLICEGFAGWSDGGRIDCLHKLWTWKRENFGYSNWGQGSQSTQSS